MSDAAAPAYKKRKAGGRPIDENIWKHFKQIDLPPDKTEKAKRNHDPECRHCGKVAVGKPYKMKEHLSLPPKVIVWRQSLCRSATLPA